MASDKQLQANRRNIRKSTGPKTPEGKYVVRHNALRHRLLSQEALLPNEDEAALKELGQSLRAELKPVGEMENLLVERIIASAWRLRRLVRVEAGMFAFDQYGMMTRQAHEVRTYAHTTSPYDDQTNFGATTTTDRQKHREIEERAREMKRMRDSELTALGQTFVEYASIANAFSKLSRGLPRESEASIEPSTNCSASELPATLGAKSRLPQL